MEFEIVMSRYGVLFVLLTLSRIVAADSVLVLGDSLSAAYGFEIEQGWVNLLQAKLSTQNGYDNSWRVINASVSGETTAGGLARLPHLLEQHKPNITILALGANDGLRGKPTKVMYNNLVSMVEQSQQFGRVILLGMRLPPNYGRAFTEAFEKSYVTLAAEYELPYVSFFISGVTENPQYMQSDNYHPNAAAQTRILANIWPTVKSVIESINSSDL